MGKCDDGCVPCLSGILDPASSATLRCGEKLAVVMSASRSLWVAIPSSGEWLDTADGQHCIFVTSQILQQKVFCCCTEDTADEQQGT
jgi:hypothetical protein